MAHDYALNHWITFQQAYALGGHVHRGAQGIPIIFFKTLETEGDRCASTPISRDSSAASNASVSRVIPLLHSFAVLNAAQFDGLPEALMALPEPAPDWSPVAAAEELLA